MRVHTTLGVMHIRTQEHAYEHEHKHEHTHTYTHIHTHTDAHTRTHTHTSLSLTHTHTHKHTHTSLTCCGRSAPRPRSRARLQSEFPSEKQRKNYVDNEPAIAQFINIFTRGRSAHLDTLPRLPAPKPEALEFSAPTNARGVH